MLSIGSPTREVTAQIVHANKTLARRIGRTQAEVDSALAKGVETGYFTPTTIACSCGGKHYALSLPAGGAHVK
jgi:hypothetical protein